MNAKVVSLEEFRKKKLEEEKLQAEYESACEWEVAEMICIHCAHRWISVHPTDADPLAQWKCQNCGKTGGIVFTGAPLPDIPDDFDPDGPDDGERMATVV